MLEKKDGVQKRSVTMQDVADRCNVGKVTVSRAFNGDVGHVSQETIDRIKKVASEMGYDLSLHLAARRLSYSKTGKSAINRVISLHFGAEMYRSTYFHTILQGIMDATVDRGYSLVLATPHDTLEPIFARGDIDGVMSMAWPDQSEELFRQLRSATLFGERPVLSMIENVPGCSNAIFDDFDGGYLAVKHLFGLQHRHILHMCVDQTMTSQARRVLGYKKAYAELGLDHEVYLHSTPWYMDDHYRGSGTPPESILTAVLQEHPGITAVMARYDMMASEITYALQRMGLRVPDDISVVGFDDTDPMPDDKGKNILTTVRLPLLDLGRCATELLIDRITSKETQDKTITLPVELVVRGSTAPARP